MEINYMNSDTLIELEFLINMETLTHYHENFELLYLMNGNLSVMADSEHYDLKPGDMILINNNQKHSYIGDKNTFIGRFSISYSMTVKLLKRNLVLFWCNSAVDNNEAYRELRSVINQIFIRIRGKESGRDIYIQGLYYQMLYILTNNFLLTPNDNRYQKQYNITDDRIEQIFQYIRLNFRNNITLQDLSEHLYLSPAYISKYIKKKCDISFLELLHSVRLGHASADLLYTDSSIIKIAMDNGFASLGAFNKVFLKAYKMPPAEFRRNKRSSGLSRDVKTSAKHQELIDHKIDLYISQNRIPDMTVKNDDIQHIAFDIIQDGRGWLNNFNRLINAGRALDLIKSLVREQILYMKEHLGIEYVRIWDIYAPELYLDIHSHASQNYSRFDEVLDFLVKHELRPYIELGFKQVRILKSIQDALMVIPAENDFASEQEMAYFYEELMNHLIKRYGKDEVLKWYFEYWKQENIHFINLSHTYTSMSMESQQEYFKKFDILAEAFRKHLPDVKIGGGGFALQHYQKSGFQHILETWQQYRHLPYFISLNCFPYQLQKEGELFVERKSADMFFVKHNLELAKEVMAAVQFPQTELLVSEYGFTLSNRNMINDHCARGAFLMQNALSCIGEAIMFGHWLATDLYGDFYDSQNILFGGCGLLSKSGIPKPAFYAFEFIHHLYNIIYSNGNSYCITGNGVGDFRMVFHNFKNLNSNYFTAKDNEILITDISYMFDDHEMLTFHIKLFNVKNGSYSIKYSQINQQHGSIQDEWVQLNMESGLSMREQYYLERISTPKLSSKQLTVSNNVLEITLTMEPNEIQYVQITFDK